MLYHQKCREFSTNLDEEDDFNITKAMYTKYCESIDYHTDLQVGITKLSKFDHPTVTDELTAQEFRRGVKHDKSHYTNLIEDKHFNSWNRGFVATAFMHHTHRVLDEHYVPKTPIEISLFQEMQTFMYAVYEEHLKTVTGKSLVSRYELTHDAQSIYKELKKHDKSSTAAQLSGDTLLKYVTSTRYPGNWRGTSYAFVLHWKVQVAQYEKLDL